MKKYLGTIILCCTILLSSCGDSDSKNDKKQNTPENTKESAETQTEEYTDGWGVGYFNDDWGEPITDEPYVYTEIYDDIISETSFDGSNLSVSFYINDKEAFFLLYDYGVETAGYSSYNRVTVVDETNTEQDLMALHSNDDKRISLYNTNYSTLKELINNNNSLKIRIEGYDDDDSVEVKFAFKMDCSGFEDIYNETFSE